MSIYAMQVKTRSEEKCARLCRGCLPEEAGSLYFPRREMKERRKGIITARLAPVFPGYLFLELEKGENIGNYFWILRQTDGFYRFLPSNRRVSPLEGRDLDVVLHFLRCADGTDGTIGVSKAFFDENSRIVIKDGPLLGLEGRIVKVDRRKQRATIMLDLYADSFPVDLSFELIEPKKKT